MKESQKFLKAFQGIIYMIQHEAHARFHLLATVVVIVVGFILKISLIEWSLLLLACGLVWTAEGVNTAIELLCDVVSPEYHQLIGKVKDIASGAVLLASIFSALMGLIIFGFHLLLLK